jgi:pimeloyl-ACP methyl ester carboxylesterase
MTADPTGVPLFDISVLDTADLRRRLAATRRVTSPWASDASRGVTTGRLDALLEKWATFDWEPAAERIRSLPWETVGEGEDEIRFVHQRAADPDARAVVLLHGWPDSVLRFERVLPLLRDLNVVVPALPGYPFAAPLTTPGMSVARMAELIGSAMDALGYASYTVSGGDVGGAVAEILSAAQPDHVASLHLTNIAAQHAFAVDPASVPADAAEFLAGSGAWFRTEGGYIAEQSTRPATLAIALTDSPAGLAAWLLEKLESWADADAFSDDDLLTWITAYWVTGAIGTSFTSYVEPAPLPSRVETPTVLSVFARDIKPEPRSYAELFVDLREYLPHAVGGHFAAWEQPEQYVSDLRRAIELAGD